MYFVYRTVITRVQFLCALGGGSFPSVFEGTGYKLTPEPSLHDSAEEAAKAGGGGVDLGYGRKALCCPFDATLRLPNLASGSLLPALMLSNILGEVSHQRRGKKNKQKKQEMGGSQL